MKKMLKYFLDNLKMTVSLISIILGCIFLILLLYASIEFIAGVITSPTIGSLVLILFLVIFISVLLTLFDIFSNKRE